VLYICRMTLRAICFDYGGTLDGPGLHWLDRFVRLYADAGLTLEFDRVRAAFDHATGCGYADPRVAHMGLEALIGFHVARQLEQLEVNDDRLAARISAAFVDASRAALAESRKILERLKRHVALGVVSNFYGNVGVILDEVGVAPLLTAVVDSNRVGVSKPDPAIFALAVQALGCRPDEVLYVGDSFEKDVVGARAAGLRSAWLTDSTAATCRAPELVDVWLRQLADLEALVA
jgi:HAD superfamily hydrolase (TIGR01549 family)